jgi:3',5'-cyclic AMP phosphodiesterase CpdA
MIERKYIAVFTDQHVVEPHAELCGIDTNSRIAEVFTALINEKLPEVVISLGDIADTTSNPNRGTALASYESYQHARELLKGLRPPLLTIAGNHDVPELLEEVFPNRWERICEGIKRFSFHGVELIGIEARTGPEPTGFLSAGALNELDRTLTLSKRALIFSHFPLLDLDNRRVTADLSVINRAELAPIFARHREKIAGCFHGHLHIWASGLVDGIPVTAVPSASFAFSLEPMASEWEVVSPEPCAYLLVGVGADGSVIARPRFFPGVTSVGA